MQILSRLITTFVGAFAISLLAAPEIGKIVDKLSLSNQPVFRSINGKSIPALGGIAIFFSFVFVSTIGLFGNELPELSDIIAVTLLMFLVGLTDDILTLSAFKKFIVQLVAAFILIFQANIRLTNLHGLFGVDSIGRIPGIVVTVLTIMVIINVFNLKDGNNGLVSLLSMMITLVFGSWFAISGHSNYSVLAFSLFGAVTGFFIYPFINKQKKIFMGNTGSLFIGMLISVFLIRFMEFDIDQTPASKERLSLIISSSFIGDIAYLLISVSIFFLLGSHFIRKRRIINEINSVLQQVAVESLNEKVKAESQIES